MTRNHHSILSYHRNHLRLLLNNSFSGVYLSKPNLQSKAERFGFLLFVMVSSRFTPPFTVTQQKVLAILPKITTVPSLLGSIFIIQHVFRKRTWKIYHRILLVMTVMDFLYALKCFMSTWAIPRELAIWGAVGSTQTCDAWGFIGHGSSLSSAMYNGSLAIYFALTVAFGWREVHLRSWRIEIFLHAIPLVVGWSTAIASLLLELNNSIGWTCWIATHPPGCGLPASWSPPCERGSVHDVDVYRWALFHAELWFAFVLCVIAMVLMVVKVRSRELAMGRYIFRVENDSSDSTSDERTALSRKVTTQALLYIFFFFLTWIFPMVQFVVANQTGYLLFPLLVLTTLVNPLQGFYDAIIYARPRYLQHLEKQRLMRQNSTRPNCPSRIESIVHVITSNNDDEEVDGEIMPDTISLPGTQIVGELASNQHFMPSKDSNQPHGQPSSVSTPNTEKDNAD